MVAPVTVSERDLRALLGVVSSDRGDLPPQGLPLSLLDDLMGQIRCDAGVSFTGFDSSQQVYWFEQDSNPPDDGEDFVQVFWDNYWDCNYCSYCDRSGDLRSVTKASDFYSARQWHSTGMYTDCFRPYGMEHELMLVLPLRRGPPPGRDRQCG